MHNIGDIMIDLLRSEERKHHHMAIEFKISKDEKLITQIMTEPKLFQATYGQSIDTKDFKIDYNWVYHIASYDDKIVGLFKVRELTKILIEVHIYILPKYQNRHLPIAVTIQAIKWIQNNTQYRNISTFVPEDCIHVIKFLDSLNFKPVGFLPHGVIYNKRVQGLLMYNKEVGV